LKEKNLLLDTADICLRLHALAMFLTARSRPGKFHTSIRVRLKAQSRMTVRAESVPRIDSSPARWSPLSSTEIGRRDGNVAECAEEILCKGFGRSL
jgi:hypothetical protein